MANLVFKRRKCTKSSWVQRGQGILQGTWRSFSLDRGNAGQRWGQSFEAKVWIYETTVNINESSYIEKALAVEEHLQFGLQVESDGRLWAYSDFCGAQCENSDAVQIFLSLYRNWQQQKKAKG